MKDKYIYLALLCGILMSIPFIIDGIVRPFPGCEALEESKPEGSYLICDDFSKGMEWINPLLMVGLPLICIIAIIVYLYKPKQKEVNQNEN